MSEILRVENIEKYYGNRFSLTKAVDRMSLRVEKGEFVAIMGASGSGKTTLLNCIATIDRVSSGRIYVDGRDITRLRGNALVRFRRDSIGFVFQEFNLLDTMTAYENIALALQIQKVKEKEIRAHRACRQSAGHRKHHGQISVSAFRRAEAACGLCARRRHAAKPHPGG